MPKYVIETLQDDGFWEKLGEGPFDTYEEAQLFAAAEVGVQYNIVEVPTPMHTPGQLTFGKLGNNADQWAVYEEATGRTFAVTYNDVGGQNARLISASPDLLAAMEAFVVPWNAGGNWESKITYETYNAARAALAKAKGEDHA